MCAAYVMIIIAGVGGLLAPVVLLSPLLIILCFAGFGTWKKSQKEGMSGIHISVTSYETTKTRLQQCRVFLLIHAMLVRGWHI